jgi:transcriptional regulator with XRE-family HTH domain
MALKVAILATGRTQQDVAREALIRPQALSHVIYGRRAAFADEQRRLAHVLRRTVAELFPIEADPVVPLNADMWR